ncbi:MAG: hypothetical protein JW850_22245 [Thermoflexales bacterium]|nr:hypothetical protein [Thermoflexales bacterium]
MKTTHTVIKLAYPIILLALIAAGGGIFWQGSGDAYAFTTLRGETVQVYGRGLYRYDTLSYAAQAIGQDSATLLVGIPLLIIGVVLARRGSLRGQMLLAGGLGYMLYTYTSYAFLSAYNAFFLIYVALFSLSLFAFILAMSGMDVDRISRAAGRMPRRGIAIFLTLLAAFLGVAWLGRIVPPLLAGAPPFGLEAYTTLVIQALDLGIIVPASAITAVLLWRKRPWGYGLACVLMVKGLMMGAALIAMIIGQILAGLSVSPFEIVMFSGIALAALVFTVITFRNIEQ